MTLREISLLLDALALKHRSEDGVIHFGFGTRTYRDPAGEPVLSLQIALEEEGAVFVLLAPRAFSAAGPHSGCAYRACTYLLWDTRLVRFHSDFQTGLVQALIEIPLEDAVLTLAQLRRCVVQMVELLDHAYPLVHRAASEGVLEWRGHRLQTEDLLTDVLADTAPDVLAGALQRADRRMRKGDSP